MLTLRPTATRDAAPIPARGSRMTVSWLHTRLVAVTGPEAARTHWTSPAPVSTPGELGEALRAATAALQPSERTLDLVMAHPRLLHQRVDLPPMRPSLRQRYLERQAGHLPGLGDPMRWSGRPAVPVATREAVLITFLPRALADALCDASRKAGLELRSLIPFSELLLDVAHSLPGSRTEFRLVATHLSGTTEMAVTRGDGLALLARSAGMQRTGGGVSMTAELHRTAQFVEQTFSHPVDRRCWLGPAGAEQSPEGFESVPGAWDAADWTRRAAQRGNPTGVNLAIRDPWEQPGRRLVLRTHTLLAVLGLVGASTFLVFADRTARQEHEILRTLRREAAHLAAREAELREPMERLRRQRALVHLAGSPPPPVPLWFVATLAPRIPGTLQLTNVAIERRDSGWRYRVAGRHRRDPGDRADAVASLSATMSGDPFFARVEAPPPTDPAPWAAQVRTLGSGPRGVSAVFLLEGDLP